MQLTLKLKTIALRWRDILLASGKIRDFCVDKYKKPPTIFVGVNADRLPDKKHCPAIFILPGIKGEGLEQSELNYAISISWVILQPDVMVDGATITWSDKNTVGELIEFLGVYEVDDLGQLIYEELQAELIDSFPISKVEYSIETQEYFPLFPGFMILTTNIYPALGEEIIY